MKRIKDEFVDKMCEIINLKNKNVLEVGCGVGTRSIQIAKKVRHLTAIEPDVTVLQRAKDLNNSDNITYEVGSAEKLKFKTKVFDAVVFTLSLHHIPVSKMIKAIQEAVRVTKEKGYVIFLEPTHTGNFFDAEIKFDACDGDERKEKAFAHYSILNYDGYKEIKELDDETVFKFDSVEDFVESMGPKKNKKEIKTFLEKSNYTLKASRRISIFQVL